MWTSNIFFCWKLTLCQCIYKTHSAFTKDASFSVRQNERGKDGHVGFELASKTHQNVKAKDCRSWEKIETRSLKMWGWKTQLVQHRWRTRSTKSWKPWRRGQSWFGIIFIAKMSLSLSNSLFLECSSNHMRLDRILHHKLHYLYRWELFLINWGINIIPLF